MKRVEKAQVEIAVNKFLEETFGPVKIGFLTFNPGEVLKQMNLKAYEEELINYAMINNIEIKGEL